jgi:hypothetical protein
MISRLTSWTAHLGEPHSQLLQSIQESQPIVFEMRLIADPRCLLDAFLTTAIIDLNALYESVPFEFRVSDRLENIESNLISLAKTLLICGGFGGADRPECHGRSLLKSLALSTGKIVTKLKSTPMQCLSLPMFHSGSSATTSICRRSRTETPGTLSGVRLCSVSRRKWDGTGGRGIVSQSRDHGLPRHSVSDIVFMRVRSAMISASMQPRLRSARLHSVGFTARRSHRIQQLTRIIFI